VLSFGSFDKAAALHEEGAEYYGSPEVVITAVSGSFPVAMRNLGDLNRREMNRWLNNRPRTATSRSDDGNAQCCGFAE
jgi:hypothetical protein